MATTLLKECAAAGLTLFEIASVASRPIVGLDEEPSQLEQVCVLAREQVDTSLEIAKQHIGSGMGAIPETDESEEEAGFGDQHDLGDFAEPLIERRSEIMGFKVCAPICCAKPEDLHMVTLLSIQFWLDIQYQKHILAWKASFDSDKVLICH